MTLVSNIIDENIEKLASIADPDTFVRLLTLSGMFPKQMEQWIPHAFLNWSLNLNRMLWFDMYLILVSAKRFKRNRSFYFEKKKRKFKK